MISSSIFSWPFFLSSSLGTYIIRMLGHLTLSQRSLGLSSFLLILFSFFLSVSFVSTFLSSTTLTHLLPQLFYCWFLPECFWSQLLHYSLLIDSFFISSRSLLNFSCIFSILVSRLLICNCFVFKILNHFYYHYSELFFSWTPYCFLFCLVWWAFIMGWIFLCLFILFMLLCLRWPFCILAVSGSSLLWRFLVGGVGHMVSRFPG